MNKVKYGLTLSAALLLILNLLFFAAGYGQIRKKDDYDTRRHSIQTGELARWVSYHVELPPDDKAYKVPDSCPQLFVRQRIMIYDSDGILRDDTCWHYNDMYDFRMFKYRLKGGENVSFAPNRKEIGIIDGTIVYFVKPIGWGGKTQGYVVALTDKSLLLYRWRIMKIQLWLLTGAGSVLSALLLFLFHRLIARPVGDMTKELDRKNKSIRSFADDVLHEMKNPLASLRAGLEAGMNREKLLEEIGRAERLLQGINELSRYDTSEVCRKGADPYLLLQGLEEFYSEEPVIFQRPQKDGDGKKVSAGEDDLGRLFRNLIDNGLSFSPEGSPVRVEIEPENGSVIIRVKDEGPGVHEENRNEIFNRFYTTRKEKESGHLGLGLAIAQTIAAKAGGNIQYNENTPSGAVFTVRLPLY